MPTSPNNGVTLQELMTTEQLIPANNLGDLPNRVAALTNLGLSSAATVTVTAVAGASNVSTVTVTVKDAAGATVSGVQLLQLWTASDAAGTTISTTAYSSSLVATTGTILATITAKHYFEILTDAAGVFVGSLTDTAKTADYIAVMKPTGAGIVVSSAAAFG